MALIAYNQAETMIMAKIIERPVFCMNLD